MAAALDIRPDAAIQDALSDASLLRALSFLYRAPSDATLQTTMDLASSLPREISAPLVALVQRARRDPGGLADLHHRTFTPAGPCPTGESDYVASHLGAKGGLLGDVAAFYVAFGFDPATELAESPDHVALELTFAAWLRLREAYALADARTEAATICARAQAAFRRDHIGPFLQAFCACLVERAGGTYYGDLATATLALLPEAHESDPRHRRAPGGST